MSEAEDLLGSALGQDVRVRRAGDGVKAELRFDELSGSSRRPPAPQAGLSRELESLPRAISSVG